MHKGIGIYVDVELIIVTIVVSLRFWVKIQPKETANCKSALFFVQELRFTSLMKRRVFGRQKPVTGGLSVLSTEQLGALSLY